MRVTIIETDDDNWFRCDHCGAGHCCRRCGWFVNGEWATAVLPFICDGYVPIEGDAT